VGPISRTSVPREMGDKNRGIPVYVQHAHAGSPWYLNSVVISRLRPPQSQEDRIIIRSDHSREGFPGGMRFAA